ncbi:MAG: hypothetical protein U9O98_07785 [Asgard group archaeon]|nr:hypothetical protein [Asgard group archaeon]
MKKLRNTNRFGRLLLVGAIFIIGLTLTIIAGPPDEAPPFITPHP